MHGFIFPNSGFHSAFRLVLKWNGGSCLITIMNFVKLNLKSNFQANLALDQNPYSKFVLMVTIFGLKLTFTQ